MRNFTLPSALVALIFISAVQAQTTIVITGRVTTTDDASLTSVTITLEGTSLNTRPAADGNYRIDGVPAGEHTLVVSGEGYLPQQRTVEVKNGAANSFNFQLDRIRETVDVVESLAEYQVDETSTATKTTTRLIDVPQSVQVFPNQLIEDRAILEGNELFRNISGLNQSTYSAMTFRGFTQRELLYNGARGNPFGSLEGDVNNAGFSTSQIRLTNIQRAEVLKGPVAALYGSSEPGGLINYVTKKPKETLFDLTGQPFVVASRRFVKNRYRRIMTFS